MTWPRFLFVLVGCAIGGWGLGVLIAQKLLPGWLFDR